MNLFDVKGRVAVVTGGARGIGAMMTEGLVKAGVRVYISSRKAEACQAMADEMSKHGECFAIASDLSTMEGIQHLVSEFSKGETQLDILINNSGRTWGAPIEEFPEKGWDSVMDLNVKTPFFLTQQFLPMLRASGSAERPASVINITSVAGITPESISSYSYGPSKAAANQLTRNLAKDLIKDHINVNAIAPGLFPSNMTAFLMKTEESRKNMAAQVPMGRFGRKEDVAGLAIYLASPAGSFMSGNIIPLDGGELLKSN